LLETEQKGATGRIIRLSDKITMTVDAQEESEESRGKAMSKEKKVKKKKGAKHSPDDMENNESNSTNSEHIYDAESTDMKSSKKRKSNDDTDSSKAKKPKGILKVKKRKDKSSKTPAPTANLADDANDGLSDEILDQLAIDDGDMPKANPSFQPRDDECGVSSSSSSSTKKKKEKMRKKREEKKALKASAQEKKTNSEGEEIRILEAKEYLRKWKDERGSWKFNKTKQTWLLKNLFHKDALDDSSFSILVDYLRPLKGNAREETIKQAEAKVNEDGVDFLQAERARVIAQMLS